MTVIVNSCAFSSVMISEDEIGSDEISVRSDVFVWNSCPSDCLSRSVSSAQWI